VRIRGRVIRFRVRVIRVRVIRFRVRVRIISRETLRQVVRFFSVGLGLELRLR